METDFFKKAKLNLTAAQMCFKNDLYDACANRAYYAAFHAAIAALAAKGIKKEKIDHKWVQAEFSRRLIKGRKVFPAKFKSYLLKMQFVRNHADYSAESVRKKAAWQQICFADDMITIIEKELKNDKF